MKSLFTALGYALTGTLLAFTDITWFVWSFMLLCFIMGSFCLILYFKNTFSREMTKNA